MGKTLWGGLIGLFLGGPVGALIGAAIAGNIDDEVIEGFMDAVSLAKQKFDQLGPDQKAQLLGQLMAAHNQISQSTQISNDMYDLRVSELQGMAAEAGIDWSPGSM